VWRCFHCEAEFTAAAEAREHFGSSENSTAACQLTAAHVRELESSRGEWQRRALTAEEAAEGAAGSHAQEMRLTKGSGYFMHIDFIEGEKLVLKERAAAAERTITALRRDISNQSEGLVRRQGALDQAYATVAAQAEEIEQLKRHAKVDAIAFASMNRLAVDAEMERDALRQVAAAPPVTMPPPVDQDWQVSPADGPDWNLDHFAGGVERIERKNNMLIFHFVAGGQVCVNHGVTYVAPEKH